MALPKLLQKLFADEGKGPKLNPSIIPTKINGQVPDETGEFNLQLSDPDAATRPEILTAIKKVTEASEVTFEPDESLPSVGHNIGEEWVSYTGVIPFGGIPYYGQEVTRETYRALWEYAQTQGLVKSESEWQSLASAQNGNVAFYSTGDGSTTFRMPSIKGYVKGATSQSESGSYVAEGLPNIMGSFMCMGNASGAFVGTASGNHDGGSASNQQVTFDASRSNSIFGNSDHVTPETSVVMFGVYAFGEVNNVGALDASTLASALARVESNVGGLESNKLDKSTAHIVETWSSGANWYRKYSDGWIEQGGRFITNVGGFTTCTFNVAFSNTNYDFQGACKARSSTDYIYTVNTLNETTSGIDLMTCNHNGSTYGTTVYWYACGY